jgi:hypothetical protein
VDLGPTGWDVEYGHGRIDAAATLEQLLTLTISPSTFTFLADNEVGPVPNSTDLLLEITSETSRTISWTVTISPETTSWLSVAPTEGVVSISEPATIQIEAEKSGLDDGYYQCELLLDAFPGQMAAASTIEISLHYVAELTRFTLFPILKGDNMGPAD